MNAALDILVIEDARADIGLIERCVRQSFPAARCHRVASPPEVDEALAHGKWHLVLSDYAIPALALDDVLARCRARHPDTPFLLVSDSVDGEQTVDLLKRGVWDLVFKDNLARLAPAAKRALQDAAERRARR